MQMRARQFWRACDANEHQCGPPFRGNRRVARRCRFQRSDDRGALVAFDAVGRRFYESSLRVCLVITMGDHARHLYSNRGGEVPAWMKEGRSEGWVTAEYTDSPVGPDRNPA